MELGRSTKVTTIDKTMIIADIMAVNRGLAGILMQNGMHCVGCPAAQGETLEEAALVHGMDADVIVASMNKYLEDIANAPME